MFSLRRWSSSEAQALTAAFQLADPTLPRFWDEVARAVPGRSAVECSNFIHKTGGLFSAVAGIHASTRGRPRKTNSAETKKKKGAKTSSSKASARRKKESLCTEEERGSDDDQGDDSDSLQALSVMDMLRDDAWQATASSAIAAESARIMKFLKKEKAAAASLMRKKCFGRQAGGKPVLSSASDLESGFDDLGTGALLGRLTTRRATKKPTLVGARRYVAAQLRKEKLDFASRLMTGTLAGGAGASAPAEAAHLCKPVPPKLASSSRPPFPPDENFSKGEIVPAKSPDGNSRKRKRAQCDGSNSDQDGTAGKSAPSTACAYESPTSDVPCTSSILDDDLNPKIMSHGACLVRGRVERHSTSKSNSGVVDVHALAVGRHPERPSPALCLKAVSKISTSVLKHQGNAPSGASSATPQTKTSQRSQHLLGDEREEVVQEGNGVGGRTTRRSGRILGLQSNAASSSLLPDSPSASRTRAAAATTTAPHTPPGLSRHTHHHPGDRDGTPPSLRRFSPRHFPQEGAADAGINCKLSNVGAPVRQARPCRSPAASKITGTGGDGTKAGPVKEKDGSRTSPPCPPLWIQEKEKACAEGVSLSLLGTPPSRRPTVVTPRSTPRITPPWQENGSAEVEEGGLVSPRRSLRLSPKEGPRGTEQKPWTQGKSGTREDVGRRSFSPASSASQRTGNVRSITAGPVDLRKTMVLVITSPPPSSTVRKSPQPRPLSATPLSPLTRRRSPVKRETARQSPGSKSLAGEGKPVAGDVTEDAYGTHEREEGGLVQRLARKLEASAASKSCSRAPEALASTSLGASPQTLKNGGTLSRISNESEAREGRRSVEETSECTKRRGPAKSARVEKQGKSVEKTKDAGADDGDDGNRRQTRQRHRLPRCASAATPVRTAAPATSTATSSMKRGGKGGQGSSTGDGHGQGQGPPCGLGLASSPSGGRCLRRSGRNGGESGYAEGGRPYKCVAEEEEGEGAEDADEEKEEYEDEEEGEEEEKEEEEKELTAEQMAENFSKAAATLRACEAMMEEVEQQKAAGRLVATFLSHQGGWKKWQQAAKHSAAAMLPRLRAPAGHQVRIPISLSGNRICRSSSRAASSVGGGALLSPSRSSPASKRRFASRPAGSPHLARGVKTPPRSDATGHSPAIAVPGLRIPKLASSAGAHASWLDPAAKKRRGPALDPEMSRKLTLALREVQEEELSQIYAEDEEEEQDHYFNLEEEARPANNDFDFE